MNLDKLKIESVKEVSLDIKKLTPTFTFNMIDGMCVDANNEPSQELQDAYEYIKTSCDVEPEKDEVLPTDPLNEPY